MCIVCVCVLYVYVYVSVCVCVYTVSQKVAQVSLALTHIHQFV